MLGEDPQQPRHLSAVLDLGNVTYVALDDCFGVIQEPFLPARPGGALEGLGVAAR